jgi:hypothetical protein
VSILFVLIEPTAGNCCITIKFSTETGLLRGLLTTLFIIILATNKPLTCINECAVSTEELEIPFTDKVLLKMAFCYLSFSTTALQSSEIG